jgi:hypothetical protein
MKKNKNTPVIVSKSRNKKNVNKKGKKKKNN